MVPLAALVNWDYRPRWGIEGLENQGWWNSPVAPNVQWMEGINWGGLVLAVASIPLSAYYLPMFLKSEVAKYLFGIIFVLSIFAATLYSGLNAWIAYFLVLAYLYPLMTTHFKQDPVYSQMKMFIEGTGDISM